MRLRILAFIAAFALPLAALAQLAPTREILVLTTATQLARTSTSKGFEIQNLGPNPIFCGLNASGNAVVNKSRKIDAGSTWSAALHGAVTVWCITTVNQVTGAATVFTEAF